MKTVQVNLLQKKLNSQNHVLLFLLYPWKEHISVPKKPPSVETLTLSNCVLLLFHKYR